jgi:hypothetical protein
MDTKPQSICSGLSLFQPTSSWRARSEQSVIPEEQNRLAGCLYAGYEQATRRDRHDSSIAPDRLYCHTFRGIAPETPGAIIELGFSADDAVLLLDR